MIRVSALDRQEQAARAPVLPASVWMLGFSGHRRLKNEPAVRLAVRSEIARVTVAATKHGARLEAVSSLALGADLLFAEECLAAGVTWRCLLPFPEQEFRNDDFPDGEWSRAEACLARATEVKTVSVMVPRLREDREAAYAACSRSTVQAADLMMFVWDGRPAGGPGGTGEAWHEAERANKPRWSLDPETQAITSLNWPGGGRSP